MKDKTDFLMDYAYFIFSICLMLIYLLNLFIPSIEPQLVIISLIMATFWNFIDILGAFMCAKTSDNNKIKFLNYFSALLMLCPTLILLINIFRMAWTEKITMLSNLWVAITFAVAMYVSAASEFIEGNKKEFYIWLACGVIMTFLAFLPLLHNVPTSIMLAVYIVGFIIGAYRLKSFQFNKATTNQKIVGKPKNILIKKPSKQQKTNENLVNKQKATIKFKK